MTKDEAYKRFDTGEFDDSYAEYIMAKSGGDRVICNGDTLIEAMEDNYLLEDFIDSITKD